MTRQVINLGTADKGNGDPIRTAFGKVNDNFAELYAILDNNASGTTITTDIIGSVFADDSTKIVDGVNGTLHGRLIGDVEGSVFADDSTKLIDGITGKIVGPIQTSVANVSITGGTNGQVLTTNGSGVLSWSTASSDRLVAGTKEVVLGTDSLVSFPAVSGESIFIQGPEIGSTNSGIGITATNSIVLTTAALGTPKFWSFGTNGSLTLPVGGDILDSTGTSVLGSSSTLTFQTVPTWKYGKAGDVAGMVSADSNYFYVCFRNFIDNSNACWHRIAKDGSW